MKPLARYASLNRYVDLCRTVDVDAVALMRSVGLSPASLANPDQWVPAASIASLLERSAAESGHEDFGLLLAGLRRLSNLGPLSLVIREEPDVRSALDVLMRYEHTYNESLRIRLNEVNRLATLRISLEVGEPVDTRQSVELAVGATLQILRSFLGSRWHPVSVGFTHNAPKDTSTHRRILGETVEFDHEFTGIVFFAADLDAANQLSDELLRPYARQFLDSLPASETSDTLSRTKELIEVLLPTGRLLCRAGSTKPRIRPADTAPSSRRIRRYVHGRSQFGPKHPRGTICRQPSLLVDRSGSAPRVFDAGQFLALVSHSVLDEPERVADSALDQLTSTTPT